MQASIKQERLDNRWMLLKRGMGNGEWGMGNGEWDDSGEWEIKWEFEKKNLKKSIFF